jgi:hypothetical protein
MKNINSVHVPENAKGLDLGFAEVQAHLKETLPWLNYAFGKSQRLVKTNLERDKFNRNFPSSYRYPAVHISEGVYESLLPRSDLGNFCFFSVEDPVKSEYINNKVDSIEADIDLIFWFNLSEIYPDVKSRDLEKLKMDILTALNDTMFLKNSRTEFSKVYERLENIYKDYSLDETESQFMMQPYGGLRFKGTISMPTFCVSSVIAPTNNSYPYIYPFILK